MNTNHWRGATLIACLLVAGCRGPTDEDRNNGREREAMLTAITLKNARLLEASAAREKALRDEGHLGDADHQAFEAIFRKARDGNWGEALRDGYAFRRKRPFVEPGR